MASQIKGTHASVTSPAGSLELYATALLETPNPYNFYGIGGIDYDEATGIWTGVTEGNPGALKSGRVAVEVEAPKIFQFTVEFERYFNETSPRGTVDVVSSVDINPGDGLKAEGILKIPSTCVDATADDIEFWVVSEANSNVQLTNSYFSKNFGNPDINTYNPATFRNSRFIRVGSDGTLNEEIALPEFMLWDGQYYYDPMMCYGNRVQKGLQALAYLESSDSSVPDQLVMVPQFALYQG